MTPWKIMREMSKPFKGFEYECAEGHTWSVRSEAWSDRGDNGCEECDIARAASEAEIAASGEVARVASFV